MLGPGASPLRSTWRTRHLESLGQLSAVELLPYICFVKIWGAGEPQGLLDSALCKFLVLHWDAVTREVMSVCFRVKLPFPWAAQ